MCQIDEGPQKENASENSPEIFRKVRIFQARPNVVKNRIFFVADFWKKQVAQIGALLGGPLGRPKNVPNR